MSASDRMGLRIPSKVDAARLVDVANSSIVPVVKRIAEGGASLDSLHDEFQHDLTMLYLAIQQMWQAQALELLDSIQDPTISVSPTVTGETVDLPTGHLPPGKWRLSRFAYSRRPNDGEYLLESPLALARVTVLRAEGAGMAFELREPLAPEELAARLSWIPDEQAAKNLVALLRMAGIVDFCDDKGDFSEDIRPDLMPWEFHDLLFHNRSRLGRHNAPMGADFRFRGKLKHEPPVKPNVWARNAIPLSFPSQQDLASSDPPFSYVLESRRSNRNHSEVQPISAAALGQFLFRSARNRYHYTTELGEFTSRPYPSGGGSYELEIYLTIDRCIGLERGFHYYDPDNHTLSLISHPNADVDGMLYDAWISSARLCHPQVLITIASRFHRVAWKYSGMAYATQLKNTGVLLQTLYLVATSMGLAGCGLGLGNSARFCRLSKTNYFEEGSIGEFMLGTPA